MLIRVAARHLSARHLDDDDSVFALSPSHTPLKVFTAPLGIRGVLSSRPCAGDALSASVLKRWREAGFLPNPLDDTAVVFVRLDDGIEVPFPRACVLTTEEKTSPDVPTKTIELPQILALPPQRSWKSNVALWRSRKRPRSPIAVSDDETSYATLPSKAEPVLQPFPPPSAANQNLSIENSAPTAESLNDAFNSIHAKDPPEIIPKLKHPLIHPIPQPTFQDVPDPPQQDAGKAVKGERHGGTNSTEKALFPTVQSGLQESGQKPMTAAPEQSSFNLLEESSRQYPSENAQSSHGLEALFMGTSDITQDTVSAFEPSGTMDITDFSVFDDDVTVFFRDNLDDRLPTDDNILLSTMVPASSAPVQTEALDNVNPGPSDDVQSNEQVASGSIVDAHMEVDSTLPDSNVVGSKIDGNKKSLPEHGKVEEKLSTILESTLATLRCPLPSCRPEPGSVKSEIMAKFEEDHYNRQSTYLKVAPSIIKQRVNIRERSRRVLVSKSCTRTLCAPALAHGLLECSNQTSQLGTSLKFAEIDASKNLRGLYVPRRFMKRYSGLKRGGINASLSSLRNGHESDSGSSDSDDDDTCGPPTTILKSEMKYMSHPSTMQLPDANSKPHTRVDINTKPGLCMEYNPLKIVDSVAVDCASICMVLAAERASHASSSPNSMDTSSGGSGTDLNASPPGPREFESKCTSTTASQGCGKSLSGMVPKSQNSSVPCGSPPARASKKERDLLPLLTLLEMQVFGRMELDLFNHGSLVKTKSSVQNNLDESKPSSDGSNVSVSTATARRVLLGLARTLEMSDSFKSWIETFREVGKDNPIPSLKGPLSVSAFLGDNATVFPLNPARVCVGYNKEWVETGSRVLPLWEKTGLEPYSDPKNVEYLALGPKELEEDVKLFLRDVSTAYEECLLGKHQAIQPDPITHISNSVVRAPVVDGSNCNNRVALSDSEKAMTEQYQLAITTIYTKLQAIVKEQRKQRNCPKNIVVYVISPFGKKMEAANVALLQAVAPLIGTIPGTAPSVVSGSVITSNLPPAPWRASSASTNAISITVRMIPREVVDRRLVGQAEVRDLLDRPRRPQLIKAVCFAVYSSIRYKRIRPSSIDTEVGALLTRGAMTDDLMSPMTPEIFGEAVGGSYGTPISPMNLTADECSGYNMQVPIGNFAGSVDQSWVLSPSYLHEAAIVLGGVGEHTGEHSNTPKMVLHLAYAYCESASRLVFAWTDWRGEQLDMSSVPVSKSSLPASRRKAFWGMWARGQRWRLAYVTKVHATICKLDAMSADELEDWEWVLNKVVCSHGSASTEVKGSDGQHRRILRRFPRGLSRHGEDLGDTYVDVPTPATPCTTQPACTNNAASGGRIQSYLDIKLPGISSVSVLNVQDADMHMFLEKSVDSDKVDRRDFAMVSDFSCCKGMKSQTNVILARFADDGIKAIEVGVMRHYGVCEDGEDMGDERSTWDAGDVRTIGSAIASNFHDLRYVATPPSYPQSRWLSMYPVHVEAVRTMQMSVNKIHTLSAGTAGTSR